MRRILLDNVAAGMKIAKPLFAADGKILLNAGLELKDSYVKRLKEMDVSFIYIEDDLTADIEVADVVSDKIRMEAVSTAKSIMDNVKVGKRVDASQAKKTANSLVDELCSNQGVLVNFIDMRTKSDYLFSHSVNVCILSIMTGISRGYDELRLRDLGVGALLHDIGKISLDPNLLNKNERLTEQELEEIRKHCQYGFETLRKNPEINLVSAHCAFQHHERYDGTGYPRGLVGDEIHEYGQIVALADVYDALTTDVSYRNAVPVYEALAIITSGVGKYFAPEIVTSFTSNIAVYPIGTVVRLSNNEIGVVVDITKEAIHKPVVRMIADAKKNRISGIVEIDLSKNSRLYIADVMER
ncbi:MAG: metal dependent phosphohydrolase [Firmicutes bacterium]|nr:metal dependent phosphohydrolase [Bacillota bacterium]